MTRGEIRRAERRRLAALAFDEEKHPRHPSGKSDGGKFAPKYGPGEAPKGQGTADYAKKIHAGRTAELDKARGAVNKVDDETGEVSQYFDDAVTAAEKIDTEDWNPSDIADIQGRYEKTMHDLANSEPTSGDFRTARELLTELRDGMRDARSVNGDKSSAIYEAYRRGYDSLKFHMQGWGALTFDESKYPRHPKGENDGGEFAPKGGSGGVPTLDKPPAKGPYIESTDKATGKKTYHPVGTEFSKTKDNRDPREKGGGDDLKSILKAADISTRESNGSRGRKGVSAIEHEQTLNQHGWKTVAWTDSAIGGTGSEHLLEKGGKYLLVSGTAERGVLFKTVTSSEAPGLEQSISDRFNRRRMSSDFQTSSLTALDPSEIRILSERKDGSGVVEMPVLSMGRVDLGRTASGRGGTDDITAADFASAVENFSQWPGPVPIHVYPHRSMSETAGPADGFMESLFVRGAQLWGRFDLTKSLFQDVKARRWRGFSVDYGRGAKLATKTLTGFLIAGGVFTNRPASDVHFRVAATNEVEADLKTIFRPLRASTGGKQMAENKEGQDSQELAVRLATAEEQIRQSAGTIASLEGRLDDEREDRIEAEKRADAAERKQAEAESGQQTYKLSADRKGSEVEELEERIKSLETERKELRGKLSAKENETLGEKVSRLCRLAVADGVPPAKLKAYGDWEKNPLQWMTANFASLEAAELTVKQIPRDAALRLSTSSREKVLDDSTPQMDEDRRKNLISLGLNPIMANAQTAGEIEELVAAGKLTISGKK